MTATEMRYAQIEKKMIAFIEACEHSIDFLVVLKFDTHMDHKSFVALFSSKKLEVLPLKVQIFRLRMLHCEYSISHVPGKQLVIADTPPAGIILYILDQDLT